MWSLLVNWVWMWWILEIRRRVIFWVVRRQRAIWRSLLLRIFWIKLVMGLRTEWVICRGFKINKTSRSFIWRPNKARIVVNQLSSLGVKFWNRNNLRKHQSLRPSLLWICLRRVESRRCLDRIVGKLKGRNWLVITLLRLSPLWWIWVVWARTNRKCWAKEASLWPLELNRVLRVPWVRQSRQSLKRGIQFREWARVDNKTVWSLGQRHFTCWRPVWSQRCELKLGFMRD